jgi:copper chaperone
MKETRLKIPDMSCGHCVAAIRNALETLEGVEEIDVSLDTKTVNIRAIEELEEGDLVAAVRSAGYTPEVGA